MRNGTGQQIIWAENIKKTVIAKMHDDIKKMNLPEQEKDRGLDILNEFFDTINASQWINDARFSGTYGKIVLIDWVDLIKTWDASVIERLKPKDATQGETS